MDNVLSQWVNDVIGLCAFFLLWLPLLAFIVLMLINIMYCTIQDGHLKKDYLRSLDEHDRKVIADYKECTSFVRVQRRKRRLAKTFKSNITKDK